MLPNTLSVEEPDTRVMFAKIVANGIARRVYRATAQKEDWRETSESVLGGLKIADQALAHRHILRMVKPRHHSSYFGAAPSEARGRIRINAFWPAEHRPQSRSSDRDARSTLILSSGEPSVKCRPTAIKKLQGQV